MKSVVTLAAGLSLFSVTGYLLYLLLKKEDEEKYDGSYVSPLESCKREVKIPKDHVRSLIGRNGTKIKEIEKQTKTKINFKDEDKNENYRICLVKGSVQNCNMAESLIHNHIASQPIIETKDLMVPRIATGRIIGRGGEKVHYIQSMAGARIVVAPESETPESDERRINIKGQIFYLK